MTQPQPTRRKLLGWLGASAALPIVAACGGSAAAAKVFPINLNEGEWRKKLTPVQFSILREKSTEPPGTSALLDEHRKGQFLCAADGNPLFESRTKFDSGTGWPSFWQPIAGGVLTSVDFEVGYPRTEVHCSKCGGHLGHVFDDGPPPTGKRYCMNGGALQFRAA